MRVEPQEWESTVKQWMNEARLQESQSHPLTVKVMPGLYSGRFYEPGTIVIKIPSEYEESRAKQVFYHEFFHYLEFAQGRMYDEIKADKFAERLTGVEGFYRQKYRRRYIRFTIDKEKALELARELEVEVKVLGSSPRGVLLEAKRGSQIHRTVGWGKMRSFLQSIKAGGQWWEGEGWGVSMEARNKALEVAERIGAKVINDAGGIKEIWYPNGMVEDLGRVPWEYVLEHLKYWEEVKT